ncbi:hypothetical protein [Kribbella sp. NPDC023855]|uniref:hypothetical protein n=1 Tax=Kribbella sp. NPDC023855 TaxID=3154698 RepID=UPI0033E86F91
MKRALAALVTTAALLVAAASPAGAGYGSGDIGAWQTLAHGTIGDPATADVLLVGDSITTRCWTDLRDALAAKGKTLAVNYWSGRPTTPAVDWLTAQPVVAPLVVMAKGSNDIFDPTVMATQIQRTSAYLLVPDRLLWVDVQAARTGEPDAVQLSDQRNSGWINAQIRDQLAPSQIVPWSVWFASSPNRIPMYLQDGVHPWVTAGTGHGDGCAFWAAVLMGPINQRLTTLQLSLPKAPLSLPTTTP